MVKGYISGVVLIMEEVKKKESDEFEFEYLTEEEQKRLKDSMKHNEELMKKLSKL